ncbi:MAG: carbon-nitrogen hydrolase, partial [Chloroflexi bacterium]|nr:carbon-nitrogen hydrolase [Chloroflexota bacterium]
MTPLRVAAVQLGIGLNQAENLAHCLDSIQRAAAGGAQLIVLPEFCNYPSFFASAEDAWRQAITIDGPLLFAIGDACRNLDVWISVTVSLQ